MSYKTKRILFFVATIFVLANISQAKYLLVEVDGEPTIEDILPGVLPVNITTVHAGSLLDSDLSGTYF